MPSGLKKLDHILLIQLRASLKSTHYYNLHKIASLLFFLFWTFRFHQMPVIAPCEPPKNRSLYVPCICTSNIWSVRCFASFVSRLVASSRPWVTEMFQVKFVDALLSSCICWSFCNWIVEGKCCLCSWKADFVQEEMLKSDLFESFLFVNSSVQCYNEEEMMVI